MPGDMDLQEFIDAIPFYVMLIDAEHRIIMTNRAIKKDLGIENPEEIIGGYCPKVVHGLDEPYPGCPLEEVLANGTRTEQEFFDPKTGRWVSSAIYPTGHRTAAGQELFLHFIVDITERKLAEAKIQESYDTQAVMNHILRLSLEDVPLENLLLQVLDLILSMPWLTVESKGAIFLTAEDSKTLNLAAHRNMHQDTLAQCASLGFGTCICGRAASSGEFQFVVHDDAQHAGRCKDLNPHGHYCVPISNHGKILGVINIYLKAGKQLDGRETEILNAIANSLAGVIQRKQTDAVLRAREQELEIKTGNLEEMNTALRVLLKKREEDKAELADNVLSNVKSLVNVYLDKLKASNLSSRQAGYVDVLQSNFASIISPFSSTLTLKQFHLTPVEMQVADLTRQGRTTKEMAGILDLSARTIDFHRQNIRRKLNLKNKKANLRAQLMALDNTRF